MASGEAWDGVFDAWDELATGTTGEDAQVGVRVALRLYLPNRRIRDPYVRWCGRGEAARTLPISIRCQGSGAEPSSIPLRLRGCVACFTYQSAYPVEGTLLRGPASPTQEGGRHHEMSGRSGVGSVRCP
jgi:hypothetical protein